MHPTIRERLDAQRAAAIEAEQVRVADESDRRASHAKLVAELDRVRGELAAVTAERDALLERATS